MGEKPTKAQLRWLKIIETAGGEYRSVPMPTYDMAGRMRKAGLIEISQNPNSHLSWPYGGWGMKITDAGRAALSS